MVKSNNQKFSYTSSSVLAGSQQNQQMSTASSNQQNWLKPIQPVMQISDVNVSCDDEKQQIPIMSYHRLQSEKHNCARILEKVSSRSKGIKKIDKLCIESPFLMEATNNKLSSQRVLKQKLAQRQILTKEKQIKKVSQKHRINFLYKPISSDIDSTGSQANFMNCKPTEIAAKFDEPAYDDFDSIKRCDNKHMDLDILVETVCSEAGSGSKVITDSQQKQGENDLDKLLLSSDDDCDAANFDTRKRSHTSGSDELKKTPVLVKLSSTELRHATTTELKKFSQATSLEMFNTPADMIARRDKEFDDMLLDSPREDAKPAVNSKTTGSGEDLADCRNMFSKFFKI